MQINLQHSKTATDNFNQLTMETALDIAFLQEPYIYQNQVTGISRKHRIFACGNGRKRAAIVVTNKNVDALLISQLSEEDIVVVEIIQGNLKFIAASIYLDIGNEITTDLNKIENILQFAKGKGLLMAMDSNARSKTWHDVLTNKRGKILEEFIISNRIHITNEDSNLTTFQSNRGTSNVDLTIADNKMVTLLNKWQCNDQESFSDHRIITFHIETSKIITKDYISHGIKYITSEEGFKKFDSNFINDIKNKFKISEIGNPDITLWAILTAEPNINNAVEKYQGSLSAACKKSFNVRNPSKKTIEKKSVPWWTVELTIMRKKINAIRRRYQRTKKDNNLRETRKQQYLQEKRKYEAKLRNTKMNSWKQYCNATTTSNPWNAVYKLAKGNLKSSISLSTIRKPDGTITTDTADTIRFMIDSFTPTDDEETDNESHKLIRAQIKEPIQTEDDKSFTPTEIGEAIKGIAKNKAPGEDGITSDILLRAFNLLPKSTTALYNGCLRSACFPRIWKTAKLIPIVKPGKETCDDISKYRPISLIKTAAKVLEKILINRIMYHMYSNNIMSERQYGFTPQTSTVDAVMALKDYVQDSLNEGQYVALISLDVKGAFDAAWWPSILTTLKTLTCPRNLYNLCANYFNERSATLTINNSMERRRISKGCPQGSASSPGFWNLQFNSLLKLEYMKNTKIIAYADDLVILTKAKTQVEIENYANIETQKVAAWARENKIKFNEQKSKMMVLTRRKPKIKREYKIYLNNTPLQQEETIKYLGVIIDKRLNFNAHIEYTTGKCIKLIHALSKSAKINWGLRHDVLQMIYSGAILPILSYGVQVWEDGLQRKSNATKLRRIQRLANI
jgi:hypothetical protein